MIFIRSKFSYLYTYTFCSSPQHIFILVATILFLFARIVSLYGSTIPEMYKKLDKLAYNEESMPKYIELKHRLDVTRVEMLNLYRIIIYEPILNIQEKL